MLEFLHSSAVKMLDIKYSCSLLCVEVKYTTHDQELLSNVFLQYVKYKNTCVVSVFLLHILGSKTIVNRGKTGWDRTKCFPVDKCGNTTG